MSIKHVTCNMCKAPRKMTDITATVGKQLLRYRCASCTEQFDVVVPPPLLQPGEVGEATASTPSRLRTIVLAREDETPRQIAFELGLHLGALMAECCSVDSFQLSLRCLSHFQCRVLISWHMGHRSHGERAAYLVLPTRREILCWHRFASACHDRPGWTFHGGQPCVAIYCISLEQICSELHFPLMTCEHLMEECVQILVYIALIYTSALDQTAS